MIELQEIKPLREQINSWRANGETIAFVPTMGNLHEGHLSLIDIAKENAGRVVASIYVNPLQFSPDEDYASYPRTLDDDLKKLGARGVDLVFMPDNSMLYAEGEQSSCFVEVPVLSHIVEGEFRPHFFRGVATVVLKLFNLVQPDIAVFGEKDFQQLLIIRRMVEDLCLPIKIIGGGTRREDDGLAMSSRNNYLKAAERIQSRLLSEALMTARHQVEQGVGLKQVEKSCIEMLSSNGFLVDYVTIRETSRLSEVSDDRLRGDNLTGSRELIILAAVKIGKTRLIDNIKIDNIKLTVS
jgi:pantoate--beta-alanine ligase